MLEIVLDEAAEAQWLGVFNDARLALGTALDITEDTELDDFDADDPAPGPLPALQRAHGAPGRADRRAARRALNRPYDMAAACRPNHSLGLDRH